MIFKSAVMPMRLYFEARHFPADWKKGMPMPEKVPYAVVVKNGDDMRQDQLVLQMFTLMDSLLKDVNLDFKFTLYKVLACTKKDGIMEFVADADTIQNILNDTSFDVSVHLKKIANEQNKQEDINNTYLLSNAGYAVATYLMAIGDRHLENLMLTNDGHMWHLDFGFILGNNPGLKQYYPPIRMNKAMILGMGGRKSEKYETFKSKTIDAFLYLRNYRQYIVNILVMMIDASIPDLSRDHHDKILSQMNERFMPDLTNEKAREKFTELLDYCVDSAFMANSLELMHRAAVFIKY
jgi:phosphatidylinositol 3-kinase